MKLTRVRILTSFCEQPSVFAFRQGDVFNAPKEVAEKWISKAMAIAAPEDGEVEQSIKKWGFIVAKGRGFQLAWPPAA